MVARITHRLCSTKARAINALTGMIHVHPLWLWQKAKVLGMKMELSCLRRARPAKLNSSSARPPAAASA